MEKPPAERDFWVRINLRKYVCVRACSMRYVCVGDRKGKNAEKGCAINISRTFYKTLHAVNK